MYEAPEIPSAKRNSTGAKPKGKSKGENAKSIGAGERDPNAPKPPQTAFIYFGKAMRPIIQAEADAKAKADAGVATSEEGEAAAAAAPEPSAAASVALGAAPAQPPALATPAPPAKPAAPPVLSFAEVNRLVGERWKAASADEKSQYEAIAAADRERYAIESHEYQAELDAKAAAAIKGKRGPNKKTKEREAAAAAAAASTAGQGQSPSPCPDQGEGGTPGGGGTPSGAAHSPNDSAKKRRVGEHGGSTSGGGPGSGAGSSKPGRGGSTLSFPMEDLALLQRESAHRQMLVASGRSQPAPPRDGNGSGGGSGSLPAYVFPPRGVAPQVLPPLPVLPAPTPQPRLEGLSPAGMTRLMMMWDFCNLMGETFRLRPLTMPLAALMRAVGGDGPVDASLASSLACCMLRVLARDVVGLEGWGMWLRAVDDAMLPLLWPQMLAHLLFEDGSYASFADSGGSDRLDVVRILRSREWAGLSVTQRLDVLVWLADNSSQCQTVRSHLDKNAETLGDLQREQRRLLDEEGAKASSLSACEIRVDGLQRRVDEWNAQQAARLAQRKRPLGAAPDFAEEIAEETAQATADRAALAALRTRRLEVQATMATMPMRALPLGLDRDARQYIQLGGAHGADGVAVYDERDASWGWVRGKHALRQLFLGLNPKGLREGALLLALQRNRLCTVMDDAGAVAAAAAVADEAAAAPAAPAPAATPEVVAAPDAAADAAEDAGAEQLPPAAVEPAAERLGGSARLARRGAAAAATTAAAAPAPPPPSVEPAIYAATGPPAAPPDVAAAQIANRLRTLAASTVDACSLPSAAEASVELAQMVSEMTAAGEVSAGEVSAGELTLTVQQPEGGADGGTEQLPRAGKMLGLAPGLSVEAEAEAEAEAEDDETRRRAGGDAAAAGGDAPEPVGGGGPLTFVVPMPRSAAPQLRLLCGHIRELEQRLRAAGMVWRVAGADAGKAAAAAWGHALGQTAHPRECAASIRVLDAYISPDARSREWDATGARRWRQTALGARTVGAVAELLHVLDHTCAWDAIERTLAGVPAPSASKKGAAAMAAAAAAAAAAQAAAVAACDGTLRPRMDAIEYARVVGEAPPEWMAWCDESPTRDSLRCAVAGVLFSLTPRDDAHRGASAAGGGWAWARCGLLNEGSPADLKGLTVTEVRGVRLTVWYEETEKCRYTGEDKPVDVSYTGVVLGVHYRDGLSVRFDHTLGADGKAERIHIANEDDWMWGTRSTKPANWDLSNPLYLGDNQLHLIW